MDSCIISTMIVGALRSRFTCCAVAAACSWVLCPSDVRADDDAPEAPECPVVKAKALAMCAATRKDGVAACSSTATETTNSCASERSECLAAERATRGIGPAVPSTCAPTFQQCSAGIARTRASCVATATDERDACADDVDVRAGRCLVVAASDPRALAAACQTMCRADGVAKVNACGRAATTEIREASDKRGAERAECRSTQQDCRRHGSEGCNEDLNGCLQIAEYMYNDFVGPSANRGRGCVLDAQKDILPCIRECTRKE